MAVEIPPQLLMPESPHDHNADLPDDGSDSGTEWLNITISHKSETQKLGFAHDATVSDLFNECEDYFGVPIENIKFLVPKGPMLKAPLKEPDMPLASFEGKTLKLMGSSASQVKAVNDMCDLVARRAQARAVQRSTARTPMRRSGNAQDSKYTFLQIKPLAGLPHPEKSEKLLKRLKEDPGIKAVMRKRKFTVGLLTEMEPLSNTQSTHEGTSRLLGLNRNKGEAIELRLRTDAHDGYRDYKTIRKTLCHELTHNVHGDHDRDFWDLCHQIEREVEAADWKSGGHTTGEVSRYFISGQEEEHQDEGGWSGGEFVLGGSGSSVQSGLSRREILAKAALERQKKEDEAEAKAVEAAEKGWRPCQRSPPPPNNDSKK
ncbi:DNA-dependent metalloprotease WSS1-like protein [Cladobotryum mycophilum]|uniref:DNA-dependent metalloprotease WSS1-like protein n=1 Tax=Cladobotryum mycophilum TaxID=491253 RepID=A0ABR0SIH1_9HYPO